MRVSVTVLSVSFGVSAILARLCRGFSAGEVNPDAAAGSCSTQQGNGLLRLQRVRADDPAEPLTDRQAGRETHRSEGRGRQPVLALSTLCGSSRAPS